MPNCKKWFENTKPDIVTNYLDTGKASLYFMDLPFLGDDSLLASSATYCAGEQGLYWEYHSHLYSNQRGIDSGWANPPACKIMQIFWDLIRLPLQTAWIQENMMNLPYLIWR
ncbi:DsbA family protein [Nitrosopumilus sp.]|uniref:DsbA family protein n=1 Tax=Nitrosopumilus sp. TaxID=2024843 RepID=UPI002930D157|nr:thioredoxin domain-containing protein [Nitrosopumilus sp.]